MKIANLPQMIQAQFPDWLSAQTHPERHTFDDLLFSISVRDAAAELWGNRPREPQPLTGGDFHYLFFRQKREQLFGVLRSKRGYGTTDDKEGVLCPLYSFKSVVDSPRFFLPLAFILTEGGMHTFAKLASFGKEAIQPDHRLHSRAQRLEHPNFGVTHLLFAQHLFY